MNSIISLVVRSLYSLVVVFFFVITVQSTIAADKYDTAITDFQNYVNYSGTDWRTQSDLESKLKKELLALPDNDPALKERILAIKDANDNNLVHILLKSGRGWGLPFEQFSKLFKICGIDIFTAKNNKQLTPLQVSIDKLSDFFASREGYYDHAESELLQDELKPLVRAMVPGFIQSYKSFREELRQKTANQNRRRFDHTSSNDRSYDTINHDLKNAAIGLGVSARLFGLSSLRGIALEQIDSSEFYREMSATPEGARVLRDYRVTGQTLYNYFSDKEAGEHYHGHSNVTAELLPIYYYEGIPAPSPRDVDIKPRTELSQPSEAFFRAYKNSQGQNMAFLAATSDRYDLLQFINEQGVGVAGMLRQKDYSGQDALAVTNNIESSAERLFDIDPTLLTTPYFTDGTTQLMVLALFHPERYLIDTPANNYSDARDGIRTKLTKKGVRFDQRDAAGNTAESIAQARQRQIEQDQANIIVEEDGYRHTLDTSREFISTFINNILNKQPLDGELWHTMMHHPYSRMLGGAGAGSFIDRGIELILNRENSPVRSSFLQQNPEGFADQANQLWVSFFGTYDDLARQEIQVRDDHYSFEEPMIARPVRVLEVTGRSMRRDQTHATFEIMQTLQSNILAAGGTFGVNFKRTANEDEANIMIESLGGFGASALRSKEQSFFETLNQAIKGIGEENFEDISDFIASHDNSFTGTVTDKDNMHETIMHHIVNPFRLRVADEVANEIIQRLFKADSKLTIEQRFKLEDHQTNCAVMALASIFEGRFDEVDKILASRPLMRDTSASYYKSSEQRHEEVMKMAGRYHVSDGGGYRSGDDNGSDFGEEY